MYEKDTSREYDYRQRRQEAIREARATAARSPFTLTEAVSETSEAAVSSLRRFVGRIELDDIILIGLFLMILDEGVEENFLVLILLAVLFFVD